jgi:putative toxin-antitoxin system antitoxin component (TIGR02293 family)
MCDRVSKKMNIEQKLNKEISSIFKTSSRNAKAGDLTFSEFLSDKMSIIKVIRSGVPYSLFVLIKDVAPFSEGDWAGFLNISTKSLLRYKQTSKQFKPLQSEKIIEMAEVTNVGKEVFGSMEKFKLWLNTPTFSLGNMKPIELLKDSYGKELVISELTRINHGIFV